MRNFLLETYFSKWEFSAKYHLTASDIESISIKDLLNMASEKDREEFYDLGLGYSETYGSPEIREVIASTYQTASPQDIICFAGAEEGVYVAMRVLLKADSHAIVIVPNYQAAETIPLSICDVTGISLDPKNNWSLNIESIKKAIRPNTKLISINFPNNPTGAVPEKSTIEKLIDICREKGIYLFSDEVYRLVEKEENVRLPQVADLYEKGMSLNVMSKAYGLPGLRIGWIMSKDRNLLKEMEHYKHYLSICNAAPSEKLAVIALKAREVILEKNRNLVNQNADKLTVFFKEFEHLFDWKRPDGGCVGFPKFKGPGSTDTFCETLVENAGVLLLPPKIYFSELLPTPQDHFRIGFGRKGIDQALNVFRDYLTTNFS
jgi:aspartate/methionine/tyrosine aminotransferase